ncbi:MAG: hypothetical protein JWO13_2532 [Acidobacteriales bacterium]|nr:hypothetical protein [Terriglobales bacterium]
MDAKNRLPHPRRQWANRKLLKLLASLHLPDFLPVNFDDNQSTRIVL